MNGTLTRRLENLSPAKRILLEMKMKGKAATPVVRDAFSIPARRDSSRAHASFNQESLFFLEQLNPNTSVYNVYEAVGISGDFSRAALQQTVDSIAARHESLRTTFREIEGRVQQIIAPAQSIEIQVIDLSDAPAEEDREAVAFDKMTAEVNRPMDLRNDALFKVTLIKVAEQEHYLLVMMHHIVSDGWSLGVFWNEFANLYQSFAQGIASEMPNLPVQFGDYAEWSRGQLEKDSVSQTEYWKNQLHGAPALLEFPTDRPRPAVQSYRGAQEICILPAKLQDRLKRFSQRENASLFMTLMAAFNVLLARYTGQEDLVVGAPIAGRNKTETENLIGFFVNTLALRTDLSGNPTFRELLGKVKNTTLDAFSHQELPFEKIVAATSPERSLSYNPIFQVAFALQKDSGSNLEIPGLDVRSIKLGSVTAKFDLFVSAKETSDGLVLSAEYSTDLFDAATVRRLLSHYLNLLEGLVADPNRRVSELPLLSEAELRRTVVEWNDTAREYPNQSIQELFEVQAAQNPQQTAVIAEEGNLTYQQLNEQSNRIAHFLRKQGVRANSPVAILMDRSALMVGGILGILKAGGAYLPMDTGFPESRISHILEDAEVKVILTTVEKSALLPETDAKVICLDAEKETLAAESRENPANLNKPTDLAYVIYTSGSTGQPKGTMIPHKAVNRLVFNTNYVQLDSADNIAHVSNVSFDAATFELWGALLHGARLVVLDKDLVLSPKEFVSELKSKQISQMFLTTSLFNLLARENPNAFETLKTVLVGGEAADPTMVRKVLENNPPERLLNAYGPTESTTFATWYEIKNLPAEAHSIPIGRPIGNTTTYVLDSHLNPVPIGVHGELYIGGDGLADGYLNRPELNAEKFISVSANKLRGGDFSASVEKNVENEIVRLYKTGDIARYLPDGNIEFIGRKDYQIKLRGFRIELGEIESALNSHASIKECVVAVKESRGEKKIVAYYVSAENAAPTAAQLRELLKERLPDYMIPSVFFEVAEFALNANGKIDRHKLPSLEEMPNETPKEFETAKDELEIKLTLIWQKVLGLRTIGVKENFFECGGHSLIAVRLFSEIEKALGCRLPLATLFQAPTIEQLARLIRSEGWQSGWKALVPLRANGTKTPFFCVHAVGGNILEYNALAKYLDSDQPFYGLQSLGMDGQTAPLDDIEEMAAAYLEEIRQIQPAGPYYLGGRSFGGTVAYEMARQLAEVGEEVALLAIFDSYPKGWLKLCSEEEAENYRKQFLKLRIKRHLENWKNLGAVGKTKYFLEKANYKKRKYKSLLWRTSQKIGVAGKQSVRTAIRDIEEINYRTIRKYVPKLYAGKVTFFSAGEEVCPEENLTGWRRLAQGGVDVVEVPGDHQTMIKDPFVRELARTLKESIDQSTNNEA